jgi:hypothetical protein
MTARPFRSGLLMIDCGCCNSQYGTMGKREVPTITEPRIFKFARFRCSAEFPLLCGTCDSGQMNGHGASASAGGAIDLERPELWPTDLIEYLEKHRALLAAWESKKRGVASAISVSGARYDQVIYGLSQILSRYFLNGWHCTRLTGEEINIIQTQGMQLPDLAMLRSRIDAVEAEGLLSAAISDRLRCENQANDKNRMGRIWFCFFPPYIGGESGIGRFFRSWGGEALYNTHEDDPVTGPALSRIGVPCLIRARVAISSFKNGALGLSFRIIARFLVNRGFETSEPFDHDDSTIRPIQASDILEVVKFPEAKFISLTKCNDWRKPIYSP